LTDFYRFCDQGVWRSLFEVLMFANVYYDARDFIGIEQLDEANQFIAQVGAYELASFQTV
jgi:hypothetical protein